MKSDTASSTLPTGTFARTASWSLGKISGTATPQMIQELRSLLVARRLRFDRLHVWARDRLPIGKFGFEPTPDEITLAIAHEIQQGLQVDFPKMVDVNQTASPGERVLDVVLVEPTQWFIGWHPVPRGGRDTSALPYPAMWPGGVQPLEPSVPVISRAYYKAAEALAWSGFALKHDDLAIEVGSSPGGACARLLELGLRVLGIDPADMDPWVEAHPGFEHVRARAGDLPRRQFRDAKWLLVDSNVRPDQSLTTVENIVTHRESSIEGMLLTLKLGGFEHADRIPAWIERVKTWGASDIRVRNLARGKVEVCLAARMRSNHSKSRPRASTKSHRHS